ncbi:hypothetical protein SCHPADRAFT_1002900 [Schizopora paradoxa]|uniref:Uncharacterized protein n=1 Tax=Schizopora paradoxa TaxID=27342 RepID=A0A0H2R7M0_9AGAM|nr:hypothetical protein SCHPADRAFT_1002900 [Schizopora paradoxa]
MSSEPIGSRGSRRTLGERVSESVDLVLAKTSSVLLRTPQQVADQIRRLRQHEKTTIRQRHANFLSNVLVSAQDKRTLKLLCTKLLSFMSKDQREFDTKNVEKEVLALAVRDPIIYETFQTCLLSSSISNVDPGIIKAFSDSSKTRRVRQLWLVTLAYFEREDSIEHFCQGLIGSLRECDLLACHYLACAITLDLKGRELASLLEIWDHFCKIFAKEDIYEQHYFTASTSWCNVLDMCIDNILASGKSIDQFMLSLPKLSGLFERYPNDFPTVSAILHSAPFVFFHRVDSKGTILEAELCHRHNYSKGWDLGLTTSFTSQFVQRPLFGSDLGVESSDSQPALPNRTWAALYIVADHFLECYRRGQGLWQNSSSLYPTNVRSSLKLLITSTLNLLTEVEPRSVEENGAFATFLIAQSVDIDRYAKEVARTEISDQDDFTRRFQLLNAHSRLHGHVKVRNGLDDLAYIPHFEHAPYLRRFKIGGELYVTSEDLPGLSNLPARRFCAGQVEDLVIDTMLVDKHSLVFLRVNEWFTRNNTHFEVTGHFPVLAGYDNSTRRARYAALVHSPGSDMDLWYFTTVEDGADLATYVDEVGEEHMSDMFFVLALRHDPSDVIPPYPRTRKGAMDPTGPLHWLSFWPKKDPDYFEDERLRKPDDALESILVGMEEENVLLSGFDTE